MFNPRPKQLEVLHYTHGLMGVSAVPGSGKTATLSYLGARLVAGVDLEDDQEILIVTLVRAAAGNFAASLGRYLKDEFGLLPGLGYRVGTLHALASDIVRERPSVVGLAEDFTIIDEREADDILRDAVEAWVRTFPDAANDYLAEAHFGKPRVQAINWPDAITTAARGFIRNAKDMQLSVLDLRHLLAEANQALPLARMCIDIYDQYERSLYYRGAVDFQDLIRLALQVLQQDVHYLERLRYRWPYVLEDEAQDSSLLQEQILRLLVGEGGNWVRVGDPNQAIYETFTTANPRYLREFLHEQGVQAKFLPNSGRSSASIIGLANQLIRWTTEHPNEAVRARQPLAPPFIELTPPGDPQGNPPDRPDQVHLIGKAYTPDEERDVIIRSVRDWLPDNQDKTVAILLPINSSGATMVQQLRKAGIPYVENLRSTTGTRAVVGTLAHMLSFLLDPRDNHLVAGAYRVWRRNERGDEDAERSIDEIVRIFHQMTQVEDFIWPRLRDWLDEQGIEGENPLLYEHLLAFRLKLRDWLYAADLPVDQLILTLSNDVFVLQSELATAYSVALYMRRFAELHPEAYLAEYLDELHAIARGQRNFSGVGDDENAFDPDQHKGKVTVTTMHKAKGLEWDRVYLMSVSNYDYPSADPFDTYMSERWFIRDSLNLDAEAVAQLTALVHGQTYHEGQATQESRLEYAAERLRLLYVGITRARQQLIVTWNTGHRGEQVEARPLAALRGWWEQTKTRSS